jgi:spore coat protein U-like protein
MTRAPFFRRVFACALPFLASMPCMAACTVTTTSLSFSVYDVFSTLSEDITGTITVKCSPAVPYVLSLSTGGGAYTSRVMVNGQFTLSYNLYIDAARVTVWGDGSAGTATLNGNAEEATYTIYGRVPARQNVQVGEYTDTLVATVTY